jgi:hypothetical protein
MQAQSISTSTIVLAVATCIPFGLAIKDTLTSTRASADELEEYKRGWQREEASRTPDSDDEDYREVAKRRALDEFDRRAAIAKREREEQAARERAAEKLKALFGDEIATLGTAFENIRLGEKVTVRPDPGTVGFSAMLIDNGAASHTLWIEHVGDCPKVLGMLRDAWGNGRKRNYSEVWVNEHAGQRAVLDAQRGCDLKFEKIVPVTSWLDKSQSSIVPMWAVGQPVAKLKAAIGVKGMEVEDQITWTDVGVGAASGPTQLTAYVHGGRVTGVLASFETDVLTQDLLIQRITELTGTQPQADAPIWPSNPSIEIQSGAQLALIVGKSPK